MKKVSKQMSMEISGGHTVVAYPRNGPDNEYEASKPGVAGWVRKCPAKGHTTCHEYSGLTYDPKYGGNGRVYVCRSKGCNQIEGIISLINKIFDSYNKYCSSLTAIFVV